MGKPIWSLKGGLETLVRALQTELKTDLDTRLATVQQIKPCVDGVEVTVDGAAPQRFNHALASMPANKYSLPCCSTYL